MRTTIRRYGSLTLVALLGAGSMFNALAKSHKISARSVVSITAKTTKGTSQGTGFIWSRADYAVTALHVVAGARKITVYSEYKKASSGASVVAVVREADLALLKLETDLGLVPVTASATNPNSSEEYFIWGYPRDVATMQGDPIRFSMSLGQNPTLKNIFKSASQFKKILGEQGYPSLNAKILRISSTIQPGHSGAPIFNRKGRLVGIGDGGLRQGIARINWAIPASVYLPGLPVSREKIPQKASVHGSLLSHKVEGQTTVKTEGEAVLEKVWTTSLTEVLSTADASLLDIFNELNEKAMQEAGKGFENAMIDVYEDDQTGATIAVPRGFAITYDADSRLLKTHFDDHGRIDMAIQIVMNDTWEQGMQAMADFERKMIGAGRWLVDPEIPDMREAYPEDPSLLVTKFRYTADADDNAIDEMNLTLTVDRNDFLGTAVVARQVDSFDDNAWYQFYLMHFCAELADFTID
ncbi:MAG: serine protease [Calditrichaeota bacterium]|nr:MAG: serine protease [Calditrichota bacterium]